MSLENEEENKQPVQRDLFGNEVRSWVKKRTENVSKKHNAIRERFKELYKIKRIRYDDVIEELATEFFMSQVTISKIITK